MVATRFKKTQGGQTRRKGAQGHAGPTRSSAPTATVRWVPDSSKRGVPGYLLIT